MAERNDFSTNQFRGMPSYSFWRLVINCGQQQYPTAGRALFEQQKDLLCPKNCSYFTGLKLLTILSSFLKKLPQSNKTQACYITKYQTLRYVTHFPKPWTLPNCNDYGSPQILRSVKESFLLKPFFIHYKYFFLEITAIVSISRTSFIFCHSFLLSPFNVYPFK